LNFVLHPDRINLAPSIGITPSGTTSLAKSENNEPPAFPGSAASRSKPRLQGGDRIVSINGEKIENVRQLRAYLGNNPGKPLEMTLESTVQGEAGAPSRTTLNMVTVPPQPMRTLGLVMEMGEIEALQEGSPAEKAGLRLGDRILEIVGTPLEDPLRFPEFFALQAGKSIVLKIKREGKSLEIPVTLRETDSFWPSNMLTWPAIDREQKNMPIPIPQLGIAYHVGNRVTRVLPGSPAEKAGIKPGAVLHQAVFLPPDTPKAKADKVEQKSLTIAFDEKNENWPLLFLAMQLLYPDTQVELTLDNDRKVKLQPVDATDWFSPDRGFLLATDCFFQQAGSVGESLRLGASETWESLTMVVKFLQKLKSRQVSPFALGGPGTIAYAAYQHAKQGTAAFLLFLTLLSANLAVLNVLPIPMLDGGHLVFLAYEGIRGKPADERVQIVLSVIGLILLLSLMIFVCGLDVQRLFFR
jgi:regulator of sigma E protease